MLKIISDYMEKGFLENIIDMFRHDKGHYSLLGELLGDERSRVRIGVVALVETLLTEDSEYIIKAVPDIADLLNDSNPTIRGDAAYLLGIIGHSCALKSLEDVASDDNEMVRETVREAIEEINNRSNRN